MGLEGTTAIFNNSKYLSKLESLYLYGIHSAMIIANGIVQCVKDNLKYLANFKGIDIKCKYIVKRQLIRWKMMIVMGYLKMPNISLI